ncbi:MAG: hypothetical protein HY606_06715, partial [Planctomycetes bacterium]|nr:hypothetical protein [Planctomycetota bacterium]
MQVKHSNTSVVTYIEVALFIIIASSILILVYPKQSILELLQKETGNGELAAAYLRNIANQYPNDKQAWAALVTQYMKT